MYLILLGSRFVVAAFLGYKFNSYVHIQLDIPSCAKVYPGSGTSECCQCVLAFEGQRGPAALSFLGSGLRSRYDAKERTYFVSGDGVVTDGKNSLELRDGKIFLNKHEILVRSTPMRVLLTKDGELKNQFFA